MYLFFYPVILVCLSKCPRSYFPVGMKSTHPGNNSTLKMVGLKTKDISQLIRGGGGGGEWGRVHIPHLFIN